MVNTITIGTLPDFGNEEVFRILIEQAPTPVGLYVGREMRIALVNQSILNTWGKDASVVGKTFVEALPELKDTPFPQLLDDVFTSGIPYSTKAACVRLEMAGILQTFYFDFTYTPLKKEGVVWGILNTAADVTELVLAQQKVSEAEERLNFALNSAEVGTWNLDIVNNLVIWDDRCKELYGFAPGDKVPYEHVLDYMHPDDRPKVDAAVKDALDPDSQNNYDIVFRTIGAKDKKLRWLHCKGRAYFNAERKPTRFSGIALDISDEVEARYQQQRLLSLIDNSSDYMSITEPNGQKSYINKAGRNLLGIDEKVDISHFTSGAFHVENDGLHQLFPSLTVEDRRKRIYLKHQQTGEIIPGHADIVPITDPITGEKVGQGSIIRDIRKELAARQALADSEDLFRRITTASPTGLWITDEQGNITYVNHIWLDWTGGSLDEQLGTGWTQFILPEDKQQAAEKFAADFARRHFHESTFRIQHKNGRQRWVVCTGNPQYDSAGNFINYIGACVDITEQKQLQRQKDDFIGVASHELRTPVTSIKAYAQVLEAMFTKNGDLKTAGMLQKMDAQLNRLTSLISDLLDVTKINTGRLQLNHTQFSFNEMIGEVVDDLQRTTTKHTIEKHFAETGNVVADRDRLIQVITNLITNAIKYSPHTKSIIVSTAITDKGELEVCVQDFGIGISEDKKGRVFEQFYRVSGHMQHTFPGLGLGLYISSEIIKQEGGRIWVNSEEGKGSTFCFSIPNKLTQA